MSARYAVSKPRKEPLYADVSHCGKLHRWRRLTTSKRERREQHHSADGRLARCGSTCIVVAFARERLHAADITCTRFCPVADAVFHQFGQCGWAHSLSYDGVHWKNVRHALTPDSDPKHVYDQCGCWDGSLTLAPGVNDGSPVILYAPQTSVPSGRSTSDLTSSDPPIMAVARASDPSDPELQRWTKDPQNPVVGSLSDMGQIWGNGNRWDGLSGGQMYSSNDSTLHSWYKQTTARGFPRGGSGGQWFQELPPTIGGNPLPQTAPTHLISTGNGQVYSAGWYEPGNETWKTAAENLLLDSGQQNGRNAYTWATLQCSGTPRRCMSIAWVVPVAAGQSRTQSPNSALSLPREVFWDSDDGSLIKLPMPELALLRNATLYQAAVVHLTPASLFTPPIPAGTGDTIDLEASFQGGGWIGKRSFGVALLARNDSTLSSAMITINCSGRACTATGGIDKPPPPPPGQLPPVPPAWPGSRLVNLSRIMPNVSFPGGSLTGDATVPSVAFCQQSCDNLTECQTWSAFTVTDGKNWRCTLKAALEKTGCPVITSARGAISGAKVSGEQRCGRTAHGFLPPRLDWSQDFTLPAGATAVDIRVLVDRSIVEIFVGGGRVAAVMAYQPPNDVSDVGAAMDIENFTSVHLFADQPQAVTNISIHQMGCGWNQTAFG